MFATMAEYSRPVLKESLYYERRKRLVEEHGLKEEDLTIVDGFEEHELPIGDHELILDTFKHNKNSKAYREAWGRLLYSLDPDLIFEKSMRMCRKIDYKENLKAAYKYAVRVRDQEKGEVFRKAISENANLAYDRYKVKAKNQGKNPLITEVVDED